MNTTATNVVVLTAATGAIAKGIELISSNTIAGAIVLVIGVLLIIVYEKMPASV